MDLDANAFADRASRLGLLNLQQVQQAWEELGKKGGELEPFLRYVERKGFITPWQSSKIVKGDADGYFLGGYRILYKIASGSFGRVFRAADSTGRVVAIKVLRRKWSEDKKKIELFEREGRVGMTLRHPNIVEILAVNFDRASKQYYIVMEFVEGGNLREILSIRKLLSPAEGMKILEDATAGLAYAFSHGITHRDMKASNILVASQGTAKLVDFGLAEVMENKGEKSNEMDVDRTVDYAGLERATGVSHGDTRSDIFFLGCVTYQMLTGKFPLEMTRSVKMRMAAERFRSLPQLNAEEIKGSPSLYRLVSMMMSLDADKRFQTPVQLLDAVRGVRRDLSTDGTGPKTIFIAEKDERLQDVLREKLKEKGFRVLIAADPRRAFDRFRQQPFDLFIVDTATTGTDGLYTLLQLLKEADAAKSKLTGILMLGQDQAEWKDEVRENPSVRTLIHPVKLKQLLAAIHELLGVVEKDP
ncbi:MAG: protein kinase [Gemmataceae bacterium]|nr:protein kinase [Gemmataceae bacterium]